MNRFQKIRGGSKMADLASQNYRVVLILRHLDIDLGFKDLSIEEVCGKHQVSHHFFEVVTNLLLNHHFTIPDDVDEAYFESLIRYLKNSHDYFIKERLPAVDSMIKEYSQTLQDVSHGLLEQFWKEYSNDVFSHMEYENREIFPLILAVKGKRVPDLKRLMDTFSDNHEDIGEALTDLKSLLIKYFPSEENTQLRQAILKELFDIEEDLLFHQQVENHILIPSAKNLYLQYSDDEK